MRKKTLLRFDKIHLLWCTPIGEVASDDQSVNYFELGLYTAHCLLVAQSFTAVPDQSEYDIDRLCVVSKRYIQVVCDLV